MKKHADQLQATIKPVETLSSPLAHRIAHGSQGQGGSIVLAEGAEAAGEIRALSLSLSLRVYGSIYGLLISYSSSCILLQSDARMISCCFGARTAACWLRFP